MLAKCRQHRRPEGAGVSDDGNRQRPLEPCRPASGADPDQPVDKQAFSSGLASLGQGLTQYSQLQSGLGNLGSTSAASLLQSGLNPQNMQAASYIAQSAPGQLQSLTSTLSQAVQFATSQGISVPSVASSALKLLP